MPTFVIMCSETNVHQEVTFAFAAYLQVDGDWHYDARKSIMLWSIDIIDSSNQTGSLEFVVPMTRPESFFPVTVNFTANRTLCQVCTSVVLHKHHASCRSV